MDEVTSVNVPVFFFTGRNDYCVPFSLTQEYFSRIHAPEKRFIWFEHSAHYPFFEEPAEFAKQMKNVVSATSSGP